MCLYILGAWSDGVGALVAVLGGLMAVWGCLGWFGVFQWTAVVVRVVTLFVSDQ